MRKALITSFDDRVDCAILAEKKVPPIENIRQFARTLSLSHFFSSEGKVANRSYCSSCIVRTRVGYACT